MSNTGTSESSVYDDLSLSSSSEDSNEEEEDITDYYIDDTQLLPLYKDRLYHSIIYCENLDKVADDWINSYISDKEQAMFDLIQLFVDIAGYQRINLKSFTETNDLDTIVSYMEKSYNSLTRLEYYFLKSVIEQERNKLNEFIKIWLEKCIENKFLFDFILYENTTRILLLMIKSNHRSIRHTGVYFTLKYQTYFIEYVKRLVVKVQNLVLLNTNNTNNTVKEQGKLIIYIETINKMVKKLYEDSFLNNWNFGDYLSYLMREDSILEVYQWIEIFPEKYLQDNNYMKFIVKSTDDENKVVRATAIELLFKLISKFHDRIKSTVLCSLPASICDCINDVDCTTGIRTVELITLIAQYTTTIHSCVKNIMYHSIYDPYYPKAYVCAKFIINRTERKIENMENKNKFLLNKLVYIDSVSIKDSYPLLVEAFMDWMPYLQNVSLYIDVLMGEADALKRESCTNILQEVVHQTFTGRSSRPRRGSPTKPVNEDIVKTMIIGIITYMRELCYYCNTSQISSLRENLHHKLT